MITLELNLINKTHINRIHKKSNHDNIKDYKCNECNYKASRNINIQQHINMIHRKI
jgi:hypothetical protein